MSKHTAWAKRQWPTAEWVKGDGRFAVVAHCRHLTVTLHPTAEEAKAALATIDAGGCGGQCSKRHQLVDMGDS